MMIRFGTTKATLSQSKGKNAVKRGNAAKDFYLIYRLGYGLYSYVRRRVKDREAKGYCVIYAKK